MNICKPFVIAIPESSLESIRTRVQAFPWHKMPDGGGWAYGTNLDSMKELAAYWADEFDCRACRYNIK